MIVYVVSFLDIIALCCGSCVSLLREAKQRGQYGEGFMGDRIKNNKEIKRTDKKKSNKDPHKCKQTKDGAIFSLVCIAGLSFTAEHFC